MPSHVVTKWALPTFTDTLRLAHGLDDIITNEVIVTQLRLVGLGLNYCVKPTSTREMTTHTFSHLAKDLRRMYALRNADEEGNYIPELCLKSDYEFKDASQRIEQGLCNFKLAVRCKLLLLCQRRHLKPQLNLSPLSFNLMQYLKNHDHLIVVQGDKNLGPCILDRTFYIFKGFFILNARYLDSLEF